TRLVSDWSSDVCSSDLRTTMVEHVVRTPKDLQSACDAVSPGDVILVHGGAYPGDKPAKLHDRRGTPEHPVVIRAADDDWISGGWSEEGRGGERGESCGW